MIHNLPEITFAERSAGVIESNIIKMYEALSGQKLYPGDPVRLFLQAIAMLIIQQRALIDFSAKQNLLAYAVGDFLDHIGILVGVSRLPAAYAQTTLKFELSQAQQSAITIPAGTRAGVDGSIDFATKKDVIILPGNLTAEVAAQCSIVGEIGNGFVPEQINIIVDPLPFVQSVTNTTTTQGGVDVESDESYRIRIQIAPEDYSTAGPEGAYISQAKKATALILDVSVDSPEPGKVDICILLQNGELPTEDILELVNQTCNAKDARPLTDFVTVLAPIVVEYDIELTYYISQENAASVLSIQENVDKAVNSFILWQKSKLGRDINPSQLINIVMQAGAKRVDVISPGYQALTNKNVAIAQNINIVFGGIEDE